MSGENITLTRELLYELVWSKPKTAVAEELGISDVAVGKICRKLSVPIPPQGYWLRSKRAKKTELKPSKGPQKHVLWKRYKDPEPEPELIDPRAKDLLDFEKADKNKISVKSRLHSAHPLVQATKTNLLNAQEDDYGRVHSHTDSSINVNICPPSINRAMLILDALIKALEKRGFPVCETNGYVQVTILDEDLRFTLEEPTKRREHQPTAHDKAMLKTRPWHTYEKYTYEPSGRLSLKIDTYSYGTRKNLNDLKKRKVEDNLNKFIVILIENALALIARRLEDERQEEARRRRQQEREEKQRQYDEELGRIQKLEDDSANWIKSQQLRSYIQAALHHAASGDSSSFGIDNISEWATWATAQADRLDPFVESPFSILDAPPKEPKLSYFDY